MASSQSYKTLNLQISGSVAQLSLCQPEKRNSMDQLFWQELPVALQQVAENPKVRALIISARGPHFSSGIDLGFLSQLLHLEGDDARARNKSAMQIRSLQSAFLQLEQLSVPVIVASQGACIGAGLEFACAADIRLCTQDAFFQLLEVQVGVVADLGGLQRLPQLIPEGLARELAYTGRRLGADEARSSGLVNAVYTTQGELIGAAYRLAEQIATSSPLTVKYIKEAMVSEQNRNIEQQLQHAATVTVAYGFGNDIPKALSAKKTGKKPEYEDLTLP